MTGSDLLSVVMPNYNDGEYIRRAIDSVVSQSRLPEELVLVDDGSTDGSLSIIEEYARRYPFIRLIRHPENRGAITAFRTGIAAMKGRYYYGMSADDYLLPGFFEKAMAMARRYPQAGIIFGQMLALNAHGGFLTVYKAPRWKTACYVPPKNFLKDYLEIETPMHSLCGVTIYRKDALEEFDLFRHQEIDYWGDTFTARAIGLKYGACYIPERFAVWTARPESVSQAAILDKEAALRMIEKTARLMRSPKYRDLFPETHVNRWERGYRRFIERYNHPWTRRWVRWAEGMARFPLLGGWVRMGFQVFRRWIR